MLVIYAALLGQWELSKQRNVDFLLSMYQSSEYKVLHDKVAMARHIFHFLGLDEKGFWNGKANALHATDVKKSFSLLISDIHYRHLNIYLETAWFGKTNLRPNTHCIFYFSKRYPAGSLLKPFIWLLLQLYIAFLNTWWSRKVILNT